MRLLSSRRVSLLFSSVCCFAAACTAPSPGDAACGDDCDDDGPKVKRILPFMAKDHNGRLEYLRTMRTLIGAPKAAELDIEQILDGPRLDEFTFDQTFECSFDPDEEFGGRTPKFGCKSAEGETYKVKYLPGDLKSNMEIYTEAIATRLLWMMGFGADATYPVQVVCADCPRDPGNPVSATNPVTGYRNLGLVEVKFKEVEIEAEDGKLDREGWAMRELDDFGGIDSDNLAGSRAEVDAMFLLMGFLQHADCKPEQQRMGCAKDNILLEGANSIESGKGKLTLVDTADHQHCKRPTAYIQDVGATFGGTELLNLKLVKLDIDEWRGEPIFDRDLNQKTGVCRANLDRSLACADGITNPFISEEGRLVLLERLEAVRADRAKLEAVFRAGRIDRIGQDVSAWADVFEAKVDEIAATRCTSRPIVRALEIEPKVSAGGMAHFRLEIADADTVRGAKIHAVLRSSGFEITFEFSLDQLEGGRDLSQVTQVQVPVAAVIPGDATPGIYDVEIEIEDAQGTRGNRAHGKIQLTF